MAMKGGATTREGIIGVFFLLLVFSAFMNVNYTSQTSSIIIPTNALPALDCSSATQQQQQSSPLNQRQIHEAVPLNTTVVGTRIAENPSSGATSITLPQSSTSIEVESTTKRTKSRILVGYFSYGITGQGRTFKRRLKMRQYFNLVDDKRICSLNSLLYGKRVRKKKEWQPVNGDHCQFIYTFVSGFVADKSDPNATKLPTELLDDNVPIDNLEAYQRRVASHPGDDDVTFLNIEENMNEGKSQTWFKYAAQMMDKLDMDYAIKTDTDCLIVMDHFFNFIDNYLPPYGNLYYAGRLSDKAFWGGSRQFNTLDGPSTINAMRRRALVEIYMAGELYILSNDLAHWVSSETFFNQSWFEQIEDHDVGLRVFDHPKVLNVVRVQLNQQFWVHPAKDHQTWKLFMNRESRRKSGVAYIPGEESVNSSDTSNLSPHYQSLLRVLDNNPSNK